MTEEMAKEFEDINVYKDNECCKCKKYEYGECEDECFAKKSAEYFYNLGYRKIPENAVVLTNDEFWALSNKFSKKELDEIVEFHKKKTRKETAEKFAKGFINDILPKIMNGHNEKALQIAMAMTNYCQEITEGKV